MKMKFDKIKDIMSSMQVSVESELLKFYDDVIKYRGCDYNVHLASATVYSHSIINAILSASIDLVIDTLQEDYDA